MFCKSLRWSLTLVNLPVLVASIAGPAIDNLDWMDSFAILLSNVVAVQLCSKRFCIGRGGRVVEVCSDIARSCWDNIYAVQFSQLKRSKHTLEIFLGSVGAST